MRVMVADNITTGERLITNKTKSFHEFVSEADRSDTIVAMYDFDTTDYDSMVKLVEQADEGDKLANEVIEYIDTIMGGDK